MVRVRLTRARATSCVAATLLCTACSLASPGDADRRTIALDCASWAQVVDSVNAWVAAHGHVPDVVEWRPRDPAAVPRAPQSLVTTSGERMTVVDEGAGHVVWFDTPKEVGWIADGQVEAIEELGRKQGLPCVIALSQGSYLVVPGRLLGAWIDRLREAHLMQHIRR